MTSINRCADQVSLSLSLSLSLSPLSNNHNNPNNHDGPDNHIYTRDLSKFSRPLIALITLSLSLFLYIYIGDVSKFSDWAPFSLHSDPSLRAFNKRLLSHPNNPNNSHSPMTHKRFRTNIIVDTISPDNPNDPSNPSNLKPFTEDYWADFTVGQTNFRWAKHSGRCLVITLIILTTPRTLTTLIIIRMYVIHV